MVVEWLFLERIQLCIRLFYNNKGKQKKIEENLKVYIVFGEIVCTHYTKL